MTLRIRIICYVIIVVGAGCFPLTGQAYIDPGTVGSLWPLFASLLGGVVAVAGFLLWPLKKLLRKLTRRKSKESDDSKK